MSSCTYRDIAKASGYSLTAVSFALRGDRRLPEATRAKIVAVADALGYRTNARVSELMESVRRGRALDGLRADMALCWYDVTQEFVNQTRHLRAYQQQIELACHTAGYGLDVFAFGAPGGNILPEADHLPRVLRARGIQGLMLAPLLTLDRAEPAWEMGDLALMATGAAHWTPELNRVSFDHFNKLTRLLEFLEEHGCHRVGLVSNPAIDARSDRRQIGAFWAGISSDGRRRNSVCAVGTRERQKFVSWLTHLEPDGLIVSGLHVLPWLKSAGWTGKWVANTGLPVHLDGCSACWIDDYGTMGRMAARHLIEAVRSGERGAPDYPTVTLVQGSLETPPWETTSEKQVQK